MAGRIGLCLIATSLVLWDIVQPQPATITSRTFVKSMTSPDARRTYVHDTGQGLPSDTASRHVTKKDDGFHIHCAQKCVSNALCKGFDVMPTQNGDSFCKMYQECEPGWTSFGSHCYRLDSTIYRGWSASEQACLVEGAHLVSITSGEENDFIQKLHQSNALAKLLMIWLGLNLTQAQPHWTDGSDFRYSNFGVPLGTGQGDCVELNQIGEWENANCTDARMFICEKD